MEESKTKFGIKYITSPSPIWVKWVFRIFFYFTSMTTLALSTFTNIPAETKLLITEWVTFANLAVHSASKMFGIELPKYNSNENT